MTADQAPARATALATGPTLDLTGSSAVALVPDAPGSVVLRGITKRYGSTTAVDSLDLQVRAGEFLSLLGPSGCGKTTTLRMLAGFEEPDAGEISISGQQVDRLPPHKRAVNTVFQAYALFPHMSVAENVAYGLRRQRTPRSQISQRVTDALDMVQMRALAHRNPRQLSGGQQQRVALARALVNRPAVLLLDEPMSALDRKLREEMQIELKLLQSRLGTTFVFVTHDQEEALSMSDRVAVMNAGRLEQLGAADTVYDSPASAFVAGFIGKQNFFPGSRAAADGDGVAVRCADAVLLAGSAAAARAGGAELLCAVRPEAIRVAGVPATGPNTLAGTLAGVSHLGHALQLVITTASGQEVLARTPRSVDTPTTLGEAVWCTWDRTAVHVFPA